MFTFDEIGKTIARVANGKMKGAILSIAQEEDKGVKLENVVLSKKDGVFEPIPSVIIDGKKVKPMREILYICGPSGVGKSTFCSNYIRNFNKIFPKQKVYILSRLSEDKTLDELDVQRIPIDETLITDPIDIHTNFAPGCMFVFDDCDTITDDAIRGAVTHLMFDILETGRHKNIYCLITSHVLMKKSRIENAKIYNEIHRLVLFPGSGNRVTMMKVLTDHLGIAPVMAKKMVNLKTRWICIGKNYPQHLLTASTCQSI